MRVDLVIPSFGSSLGHPLGLPARQLAALDGGQAVAVDDRPGPPPALPLGDLAGLETARWISADLGART